jgi:putative transposase
LRFPRLQFLIEVASIEGMPRRLRIEYPGAIYHIMARGNGRQDIVCDDHDRQRLMDELAWCVNRTSWQVFSFVILSNRLHLVLKTPEPNLARSMKRFLSSEAH